MTGGTVTARREATRIRAELVSKHWGNKIPSGMRETLNRLPDSRWWVRNEIGDGYPKRSTGRSVPKRPSTTGR